MFCTNCGNAIKQNHKFCYSCGEKLEHIKEEIETTIGEPDNENHTKDEIPAWLLEKRTNLLKKRTNRERNRERNERNREIVSKLQRLDERKMLIFKAVALVFGAIMLLSVIFRLNVQVGDLRSQIIERDFTIEYYEHENSGLFERVALLEEVIFNHIRLNKELTTQIQDLEQEIEDLIDNSPPIFPIARYVLPGEPLVSMIESVYGIITPEILTMIARVNNIQDPFYLTVGDIIIFPELSLFGLSPYLDVRQVPPGGTLSSMIQSVYGFTNQELIEWIAEVNNISNPLLLFVGQSIIFPHLEEFPG